MALIFFNCFFSFFWHGIYLEVVIITTYCFLSTFPMQNMPKPVFSFIICNMNTAWAKFCPEDNTYFSVFCWFSMKCKGMLAIVNNVCYNATKQLKIAKTTKNCYIWATLKIKKTISFAKIKKNLLMNIFSILWDVFLPRKCLLPAKTAVWYLFVKLHFLQWSTS